eukprot:1297923-Alexandrium_andersonii.AAC.1
MSMPSSSTSCLRSMSPQLGRSVSFRRESTTHQSVRGSRPSSVFRPVMQLRRCQCTPWTLSPWGPRG